MSFATKSKKCVRFSCQRLSCTGGFLDFSIRVSGMFEFSTPAFLIRDPKLLKKLAVKDFDSFLDHKIILNEDVDPLFGRALFSLKGQKWRGLY